MRWLDGITIPSEKAKLVDFTYHCYKSGMLNAVSVGFTAKNFEEIFDENNHFTGYKVIQWELLEFSAVAVPANQEALAQAVKSFGTEKAESVMAIFKSKKDDTEENKPKPDDAEKPPVEEDDTKVLLKACDERVKACEEEVKALKAKIKECAENIEKLYKRLKADDVLEVEDNPDEKPKPDDDVLEVED